MDVDQVVPFWVGYYGVIAFTTLDIEPENAVLEHPEIRKLLPDLRLVMGECEGAFETTWVRGWQVQETQSKVCLAGS